MPSGYSYANIKTNGTTTIKSGPGLLHSITISKLGATATVTLFDSLTGAGTTIATVNTAGSMGTLTYDVAFTIGLTAVAAGTTAADTTLAYL